MRQFLMPEKVFEQMQERLSDKVICSQNIFVEMEQSTAFGHFSNACNLAMKMIMDI